MKKDLNDIIRALSALNPDKLEPLVGDSDSADALQSAISACVDLCAERVPGTVIGTTEPTLASYLILDAYVQTREELDGGIPNIGAAGHAIASCWRDICAELDEVAGSFQYERPLLDDSDCPDVEHGYWMPRSMIGPVGEEYTVEEAEQCRLMLSDFQMPLCEALPYAKALGICSNTDAIPTHVWASESYSDEPTTYTLFVRCPNDLASAITAWLKG